MKLNRHQRRAGRAIVSERSFELRATTPAAIASIPESWNCIDCGTNTAPGLLNRAEVESRIAALGELWELGATIPQTIDDRAELYRVRRDVWSVVAGEWNGCLCIGCLERRLGRTLGPRDFGPHPFNRPTVPATPRLRQRRGY
jgi:hypothetical protein